MDDWVENDLDTADEKPLSDDQDVQQKRRRRGEPPNSSIQETD